MGDSATMTDFFPSKRRRIDHASTRPSPSPCVLDRVHAALKPSYQPSTVPCRDKEKAQLTSFLQRCLSSSTAGSLYVCGAPGCGKSLLIVSNHGPCAPCALGILICCYNAVLCCAVLCCVVGCLDGQSNVLSEVKQWCKEVNDLLLKSSATPSFPHHFLPPSFPPSSSPLLLLSSSHLPSPLQSKLPSPYVANLNLMSVGDPKTLYSRMALELGIRINVAKPMAKQLEEAVTSTGGGGRKRRCKMM